MGSTLVGFIFLAMDKIGRDLEDPFDNLRDDLPMTSMTRRIEINLRQPLWESDLPPAATAVEGLQGKFSESDFFDKP